MKLYPLGVQSHCFMYITDSYLGDPPHLRTTLMHSTTLVYPVQLRINPWNQFFGYTIRQALDREYPINQSFPLSSDEERPMLDNIPVLAQFSWICHATPASVMPILNFWRPSCDPFYLSLLVVSSWLILCKKQRSIYLSHMSCNIILLDSPSF